jgi:hypothetical protein
MSDWLHAMPFEINPLCLLTEMYRKIMEQKFKIHNTETQIGTCLYFKHLWLHEANQTLGRKFSFKHFTFVLELKFSF